MRYQPSLQTQRLRLRPFVADDAATVSRLTGSKAMAIATTSNDHPYSSIAAKTWIASLPHLYRSGSAVHFAVCLIDSKELIGCFALKDIDKPNAHAEMELWIGESWQRQGFATEAAKEVLEFGFHQLKLHRIYCYNIASEPKSSGLLEKLGLQREGVMRQSMCKGDMFEDLALSAILKEELSNLVQCA